VVASSHDLVGLALKAPSLVVAESSAILRDMLLRGFTSVRDAAGADFAYIGSAFIATEEARAIDAYKQCIVDCTSDDIVYSSLFTGVHGNYLKPSIRNAGMDPDNLPDGDVSKMNFGGGEGSKGKAWKDIWGCGQGISAIKAVVPTRELVARLRREYEAARSRFAAEAVPA
jgi:nitronate monooxygenase